MLSERQTRALLVECEGRLERPLNELRSRLQSADPESALWELVVLHATLRVTSANHEPDKGSPDIVVGKIESGGFCLELAWLQAPAEAQRSMRNLLEFLRRNIRSQISKRAAIDIVVGRIDRSSDVDVPAVNQWPEIIKSREWRRCLARLRGGLDADLCLERSNLRVQLEKLKSRDSEATYGPVLSVARHPSAHAAYRAIKKKAAQARKRKARGAAYQPLVLVIGADDGLSHIDAGGCEAVTLRQAIWSAILDERTQHPITRCNLAGSWPSPRSATAKAPPTCDLAGPPLRVRNSSLISAVAVVLFEDRFDLVQQRSSRRPQVQVFLNDDADATLTSEQQHLLLRCLQLNHIEFSARGEDWEVPVRREESIQRMRARHHGGSVTTTIGVGSVIKKISVPATLLHRILAGDASAREVWEDYSPDIRDRLVRALEDGQFIIGAEFDEAVPLTREEPRVTLEFGPPTEPLVRYPKS